MTETKKETCEYCWSRDIGALVAHDEGHATGCPCDSEAPEAMQKWRRGWRDGFYSDSDVHHSVWHHYARTYLLGRRAGKAEIDRMVDDVVQSEIFGPEY
jgi:hypothetical protein